MNSTNTDSLAEQQLLGKWIGSSERETLEYTFEAGHRFTVNIILPGESPSKAWGYWDVRDGNLRIGLSADQCDGTPITIESDRFILQMKGLATTIFNRQS
jgi:hypothetical protein